MKKISVIFFLLWAAITMYGCPVECDTIIHGENASVANDTLGLSKQIPSDMLLDTVPTLEPSTKRPFYKQVVDGVVSVLREFNNVDPEYIEPQHYNFTTTFMTTYSFENYRITSKSGQEVVFAPEARPGVLSITT